MDDSFEVGGTNWRGGGQTLVLYKLIESGGKIAVCGAYFNRGNVPGNVDRQLMRGAKLRLNGRTLLNVKYFPRLKDETASVARCKVTSKPWGGDISKTEIRFSRNNFEY
ncbi:hypothetical protein AIOL_002415 [Candidatus Rhodobacter oscarellae]|uniref:Uncharacterized protein n=1 Tax=Candidatus Rhodobacter oscarellae TaxID=1675527 RepID=A0A0J9E3T4_9RHOB|nr:hypothetical protein AIOL_002415 [Candidatus Rhodobacter lobularis]